MNAVVSQAVAPVADKNFVIVPDTTLPGGLFVPAFQVAKYHASKDADGKLVVTGEGMPMVSVNHYDTLKLCADAGMDMIKETQALSLAYNLALVASNWIGGVVGEGSMYQGLHLDQDDRDEAYPFDYVSTEPSERREFTLPDGSMVLDAAGNVYTRVFDDVQGDERGIVVRAFTVDSPSITTAPYPSMEKGIGWQPRVGSDWSGGALIRGGRWSSCGNAGVFRVGVVWPDDDCDDVGVRCTKPIGV